jgi:hypothetical protein
MSGNKIRNSGFHRAVVNRIDVPAVIIERAVAAGPGESEKKKHERKEQPDGDAEQCGFARHHVVVLRCDFAIGIARHKTALRQSAPRAKLELLRAPFPRFAIKAQQNVCILAQRHKNFKEYGRIRPFSVYKWNKNAIKTPFHLGPTRFFGIMRQVRRRIRPRFRHATNPCVPDNSRDANFTPTQAVWRAPAVAEEPAEETATTNWKPRAAVVCALVVFLLAWFGYSQPQRAATSGRGGHLERCKCERCDGISPTQNGQTQNLSLIVLFQET